MLFASKISHIRTWLNELTEERGWPESGVKRLHSMLDASSIPLANQPIRPVMQAPFLWYMPGLEAKPCHDPQRFNFVSYLEEAYHEIKKEFEYVYEQGLVLDHRETIQNTLVGRWGEFNIYNLGKKSLKSSLVPLTVSALKHLPGLDKIGLAYFSTLAPGTRIRPHFAPINMRLRVHLGLCIPKQCGLIVAGERYSWQMGKCTIFDDSFYHSVWNDSDSMRAVLLADFWHPDLTEIERYVLTKILWS